MSPPVVSPEDVLETLMNDGTIDAIRLKIINQLKANEELRSTTVSMVEQSKVLNTQGAEKQTKRELFDALRQELETPVLEKASKAVWQLILDSNGLGKEISETVAKTFFRLSGQEPPQSLQIKSDVQAQHIENAAIRQQRKEKEKASDAQAQHTENNNRQLRREKEKGDIQLQHNENTSRQQRKEKEREKGSPASLSRKRTLDDMKSKESDVIREPSVASDDSERLLKGKV